MTFQAMGTITTIFKSSMSISPLRLPPQRPIRVSGGIVFFFNHFAQLENQEIKYQQSTYKDLIPTVPKQYSTFFVQETGIIYSVTTSRTA
jgi:hypothetical protein